MVPEPPLDLRRLRGTGRPNQFALLPPGWSAPADLPHDTAPVFALPAERLRVLFLATLEGEPRLERTGVSQEGMQIDLVQRSRLFGFPDLITVAFVPLEGGGSTLALWSRARYGLRDFGVNRKRVRRWLARLTDVAAKSA